MSRRRRHGMLNVRAQLEYAADILEMLQKYGDCPAVRQEIPKFLLINRAIFRKHDAQRAASKQRKDLYVEAHS